MKPEVQDEFVPAESLVLHKVSDVVLLVRGKVVF